MYSRFEDFVRERKPSTNQTVQISTVGGPLTPLYRTREQTYQTSNSLPMLVRTTHFSKQKGIQASPKMISCHVFKIGRVLGCIAISTETWKIEQSLQSATKHNSTQRQAYIAACSSSPICNNYCASSTP